MPRSRSLTSGATPCPGSWTGLSGHLSHCKPFLGLAAICTHLGSGGAPHVPGSLSTRHRSPLSRFTQTLLTSRWHLSRLFLLLPEMKLKALKVWKSLFKSFPISLLHSARVNVALMLKCHIKKTDSSKLSLIQNSIWFGVFLNFLGGCTHGPKLGRGLIGATAASLHLSRSNERSKPYLWPTPQLTSCKLQLPAYTTVTAMQDPSHICDLHHNTQCCILNPLSESRDQTQVLMDTSWVCYCWATTGILSS